MHPACQAGSQAVRQAGRPAGRQADRQTAPPWAVVSSHSSVVSPEECEVLVGGIHGVVLAQLLTGRQRPEISANRVRKAAPPRHRVWRGQKSYSGGSVVLNCPTLMWLLTVTVHRPLVPGEVFNAVAPNLYAGNRGLAIIVAVRSARTRTFATLSLLRCETLRRWRQPEGSRCTPPWTPAPTQPCLLRQPSM